MFRWKACVSLFLLITGNTHGQPIDPALLDSMAAPKFILYWTSSGKMFGGDYAIEAIHYNVVFYSASFEDGKKKMKVAGRVIDHGPFADTIGAFYYIYLIRTKKDSLLKMTFLDSSYWPPDHNLVGGKFPHRFGDFVLEFPVTENDRLLFHNGSDIGFWIPVECDVGSLLKRP